MEMNQENEKRKQECMELLQKNIILENKVKKLEDKMENQTKNNDYQHLEEKLIKFL